MLPPRLLTKRILHGVFIIKLPRTCRQKTIKFVNCYASLAASYCMRCSLFVYTSRTAEFTKYPKTTIPKKSTEVHSAVLVSPILSHHCQMSSSLLNGKKNIRGMLCWVLGDSLPRLNNPKVWNNLEMPATKRWEISIETSILNSKVGQKKRLERKRYGKRMVVWSWFHFMQPGIYHHSCILWPMELNLEG